MNDTDAADHALATYGTLAPGRLNAHLFDGLEGRWTHGAVRGRLIEQGWGAAMGYPAIVLDADGAEVAVHLFVSPDLPAARCVRGRRLSPLTRRGHDGGRPVRASIFTATER